MNALEKPSVALIVGPTGVGKTEISVKIAKELRTEIISCDSMQIYKHMDIGTAKVTQKEADGVVHHMIDIAEPTVNYSVCDYVKEATLIISDMAKRGKLPLAVGGTGLYADSLTGRMSFEENASSDEAYRRELFALAEKNGAEFIHDMLKEVDEKSALAIHANNVKRVVRALEYFKVTGVPISVHNEESKKIPAPYETCKIGFVRNRENLYRRIDRRVDIMLSEGLVDEVKRLVAMGCNKSHTSMQALGYKEVIDYLEGSLSYEEMTELIKRDSRRYAKRQLTWFRRDESIHWINLDEEDSPDDTSKKCADIIRKELLKGKRNETDI